MSDKVRDRFNDARKLGGPQFRVHRQRQHFLRGMFCMREVATAVAQISVERLQMQRHRIIDRTANFVIGQNSLELIALFDADRVLMEDVLVSGGNLRRHDSRNLGKVTRILRGVGLPGLLPGRKMT